MARNNRWELVRALQLDLAVDHDLFRRTCTPRHYPLSLPFFEGRKVILQKIEREREREPGYKEADVVPDH